MPDKEIDTLITEGKTRPRRCLVCGTLTRQYAFYMSTKEWVGMSYDMKLCVCGKCLDKLNGILKDKVMESELTKELKIKEINEHFDIKNEEIKKKMLGGGSDA